MKTSEVRDKFLNYFSDRDHVVLPSSPSIPHGDKTLLFTNAGMVQFKDIFTGRQESSQPRATTVQKCVRAGGKHNDLDNVGYTSRHLTLFEMLGNFS
ncbi:MAG: alanine--tRNA ligase-related protein, partial [Planctomycetota bacterium]|nr:alanine--tRNA ligase-related protein [Planctomycetota bacterium]